MLGRPGSDTSPPRRRARDTTASGATGPGRGRPPVDKRYDWRLGRARSRGSQASPAGLEDPRVGGSRQRGREPHRRLGVPRPAPHPLHVPPRLGRTAARQREIRAPGSEREVRDDPPRRRGAAGADPHRTRHGPRRPAGTVHPERPALGRRAALRAVRGLRRALLRLTRRRGRTRGRGRGRPPWAGRAGTDLPGPRLGRAAGFPRPPPGGAGRRARRRPVVPPGERPALLQQRRPVRRSGRAHRGARGAEGGPAVRGPDGGRT